MTRRSGMVMADDKGSQAQNWAQARDRIDRGATGDKVEVADPATTPLGTDAEAGGVGTRPDDIAASTTRQSAAHPEQGRRTGFPIWWFAALLAVIALLGLLFAL